MICNQLDCAIKVLRSNDGTKFFNSQVNDLLYSLGFIYQSSCPYTPQLNETMEIKHRHI